MANVTISGTTNTNNKVNTSKFMGSAFAAGSSLSKRVSSQEKKLSVLKNIIKTQKLNIDDLKHNQDTTEGLKEELQETNSIIQDIGNALALDFANRIKEQKSTNKALKSQTDKERKESKEKDLETKKGIGKSLGGGLKGIAASMSKGLKIGGIFEAIKIIGAGIAINALWPKLEKIFQWSIDNFDKILLVAGGIFAGGAFLGLVGALGSLITIAKFLATPLAIGALLFTFGAWGGMFMGTSTTTQRIDKSVETMGKKATLALLKGQLEQIKSGKAPFDPMDPFHREKRREIEEQIERLETGTLKGRKVKGPKIDADLIIEKSLNDEDLFEKLTSDTGFDISEVTLDPQYVSGGEKKVNLPETNEVAYHSSVNPTNTYMMNTPKLHGIG